MKKRIYKTCLVSINFAGRIDSSKKHTTKHRHSHPKFNCNIQSFINRKLFHGVFSPNSKLREHVVSKKPVAEQESQKPKAYSMI